MQLIIGTMSEDLLDYVRDIRLRGDYMRDICELGDHVKNIRMGHSTGDSTRDSKRVSKGGREWFWPKNAHRPKVIAYALEYEPFTLLLKTHRFLNLTLWLRMHRFFKLRRRLAPLTVSNRPSGILLQASDFRVCRDPRQANSLGISIPFYGGGGAVGEWPTIEGPVRLGGANRKLVVIHAYYQDEAKRIFDKLQRFNDYDLVLSTPIRAIRDEFLGRFDASRAICFLVPNVGRDVFAFLLVAAFVELSPYDHFVKVHTKRSGHLSYGADWFWMNIETLIGNKKMTDGLLEHIDAGRACIYGVECRDFRDHFWANRHWLKLLLEGQERKIKGQFVPGTMFAGSGRFLRELAARKLHLHRVEEEKGQLDGCLIHGLERYFGYLAQARGGECTSIESLLAR